MSFTKPCDYCGGDGYIVIIDRRGSYDKEEEKKCPICKGRGFLHEDTEKRKDKKERL